MKLTWSIRYDDEDRLIYETPSPYHDEGSFFMFRIREDGPGKFVLVSDAELMIPSSRDLVFDDIENAKAHCERDYAEILKSEGVTK